MTPAIFCLLFLCLLLTTLSGCSSNNSKRDIYIALIQRERIQKTGEPNCDPGQSSYEDYQRDREAINNQE